jgi:gluconokinase
MVIIVMGASGAGKTTIGRALADSLDWRFVDADDLHPPENVEKMARNEPLTDADREPWLLAVHATIAASLAAGEPLAVACSALNKRYRTAVAVGLPDVRFVYLKASRAVLQKRLEHRRGHFAGPGLVASQLETLEEPTSDEALTVDATETPEMLVAQIRSTFAV